MKILLKSGTAKALSCTARWELISNELDSAPRLEIEVYQELFDSPGEACIATLTIDRMDGEGYALIQDADDNNLVEGLDAISLGGMLAYANETTWAHIALDVCNNS